MAKFHDLTGQTFGRLTVKCRSPRRSYEKSRNIRWLCSCSCTPGRVVRIIAISLKNGETKSCGCLRIEVSRARAIERNRKRKGLPSNGNKTGAE